jgi:carbon starvation protein
MSTFLVALACFACLLVGYYLYGRWLSRRIFNLRPDNDVPSHQLRDDVDFVPTHKQVIFGHHFTSIAGTGPIVGPAIAVFWGWLPALLWVVFGSIFLGAVHDLGSLVVSLRNRGQTVGEIAGRMISPRARVLFLLILFFALSVVLAIFGLVIAQIFQLYPESVLPVWIAMPLAVVVGWWVYRKGGKLLLPSLASLAIIYASIYMGTRYMPLALPAFPPDHALAQWLSPVIVWTILLFIYCFAASVLPVWILLQPRDYINSQQLFVALALLITGILVASLTGQADLVSSAPAVVAAADRPVDAPPIWPFLFITIACGAISGFHCLVSSGTSSKQVARETDALYVAYGSMLLEGALAVIVILACCAGTGMGRLERVEHGQGGVLAPYSLEPVVGDDRQPIRGNAAWRTHYDLSAGWNGFGLRQAVGAFVDGAANFLTVLGMEAKLAVGIIAVLVACFAATTLDTATRLQRYVIQELAGTFHIRPLTNKYAATGLAVGVALMLAVMRGPTANGQLGPPGTGGLILWPLFGATNQLIAGLAFLVTAFYLWRRNRPIWFLVAPMLIMIVMPAWALLWQMFNSQTGWLWSEHRNYLLMTIACITLVLQVWMLIEGALLLPKSKGILEKALPPLPSAGKGTTEPRPSLAGQRG